MKKVWVNGTFDILHIGHIKLLEFASTFGEVRVGIDTDQRIKILKGQSRPYNNIKDRVNFISSIKYINSVVVFDSDIELEQQIKDWDTDILVIGNDYINKKIIGSHLVKERIEYFDRIPNKSTTQILSYEDTSNRRIL
jgi:D-beta-D-heptose 7-phosphate kinase/D-beta-D-heptose 1-phosphate adenosyltransferase